MIKFKRDKNYAKKRLFLYFKETFDRGWILCQKLRLTQAKESVIFEKCET